VVPAAAEGGGLTLDANPLSCLCCHARLAHARGLCPAYYRRAGGAVRAGLTTWAALEAAGQALPARPTGEAWRNWNLNTPK
jgi:hypothetical protein